MSFRYTTGVAICPTPVGWSFRTTEPAVILSSFLMYEKFAIHLETSTSTPQATGRLLTLSLRGKTLPDGIGIGTSQPREKSNANEIDCSRHDDRRSYCPCAGPAAPTIGAGTGLRQGRDQDR
jgi:hypothetical protein